MEMWLEPLLIYLYCYRVLVKCIQCLKAIMEGTMNTNRFSRCIFALLGCLLIFLLAACGETGVNPSPTGSPTSTVNPSKTPLPGSTLTPTVITAPVPPTQTSCPPA